MGYEMHYGFQNCPFLGLVLCQKHSVPTLKAFTLKRTTIRIFWDLAACRLGNNTPADTAQHSADMNKHAAFTDVTIFMC